MVKRIESLQSVVSSNNYGLSMATLFVGVTGLIAWTESRVGWDFRTSGRPLKCHSPFPHELNNYCKWASLSALQSSSFTASKTIDFKSFFLLRQKSWRLGVFFIACRSKINTNDILSFFKCFNLTQVFPLNLIHTNWIFTYDFCSWNMFVYFFSNKRNFAYIMVLTCIWISWLNGLMF